MNRQLRSWPAGPNPRRAGVSSFGIGGTNAHAILEEAPELPLSPKAQSRELFTISAKTPEALEHATERLTAWMAAHPEANRGDVAWTLQIGRTAHPYRRALVSGHGNSASRMQRDGQALSSPMPCFLFPGQGSHYAGMTRALYDSESAYRRELDRCAGPDLCEIIFAHDPGKLNETRFTQPALFAVEYALAKLWMSWGVCPQAMLGHSIGEYVAACIAGVFSLEDAQHLVARRAALMQSVRSGAMLAVPLSEAELVPIMPDSVSIAAINSSRLCTLSGPTDPIAEFELELKRRRIASKRLPVTRAFHSRMVDGILEEYRAEVSRVQLNRPSIPFISNVTGRWITEAEAVSPEYWVHHLREPVRFADSVSTIAQLESAILLEVGPGDSLISMARQNPVAAKLPCYASLGRSEEILEAVGGLWTRDVNIDWPAFHAGAKRKRIPLPTYPFERKRYWIESNPQQAIGTQRPDGKQGWFYASSWKRVAQKPQRNGAPPQRWVILGRAVAPFLADQIASELESRSQRCSFELGAEAPDRLVDVYASGSASADPLAAYHHLIDLAQTLSERFPSAYVSVTVIASNVCDVTGEELICPERATIFGPCAVIPQEYPSLSCRVIDAGTQVEPARIVSELFVTEPEPMVALRGRHRWVRTFEPTMTPGVDRLKDRGVYLITGGLSGIGLALAEYLARAKQARLILVGRTPRRVKSLEQLGAEFAPFTADVADLDQMRGVIRDAETRFGAIDGVIHSAGVAGGGVIELKTREESERVFVPKIQGTRVLERLFLGKRLDFFAICSSLASVVGGYGQADYCAANAFEDAFANSRPFGDGTPVIAIGWDTWRETGMALATTLPGSLEHGRQLNLAAGLATAEGVEAFARVLGSGLSHVLVSKIELNERVESARRPRHEPPPIALHARPSLPSQYAAPRNDVEQVILGIWQELLGIEEIGIRDDFFELGGHSLLGTQVISRVRDAFNAEISLRTFTANSTIEGLAAELIAKESTPGQIARAARILVRISNMSPQEVEAELKERGIPAGQ